MPTPANPQEAKTLIGIITGRDPEVIDNYVVIVSSGKQIGVFTNSCSHNSQLLLAYGHIEMIQEQMDIDHE